jgi:hypothetical protein
METSCNRLCKGRTGKELQTEETLREEERKRIDWKEKNKHYGSFKL